MREIRDAVASDAAALAEIFYLAVHEGAATQYSPAERRAWCPSRPDPDRFWEGVRDQTILVAVTRAGAQGFMTLTGWGHLHMAFVRPEQRGTGLAGDLLAVLENRARAAGHARLTVRASHLARPFLARHGWQAGEPVTHMRDGVALCSTQMTRVLIP